MYPVEKSSSGGLLVKAPYTERPDIPLGVWNYYWGSWEYYADIYYRYIKSGDIEAPPDVAIYKYIQPKLKTGELYPEDKETVRVLEEFKDKTNLFGWGAKKIKKPNKDVIPVPLNFVLKPFEHQIEAFYQLRDMPNIALWMEQGTGKTLVAIALMRDKFLKRELNRVLIICPKSAMDVWPEEMVKHSPHNGSLAIPQEIKILSGKKTERAKELRSWKRDENKIQVAIINYDVVKDLEESLKKFKPDMILLDESHKIKSYKTNRARVIHRLGSIPKFKAILSGNVIAESPLDVWSQYRFLDPKIFGKNYKKFQRRYATMGGYYGYEVKAYKNINELTKKALSIGYGITRDEALDLPPEVDQFVYCTLGKESSRVYSKMKEKAVADFLGRDSITATIVLTQLAKLQQITGGFLHDTENQTVTHVGAEKLNTLEEVLEGISKKRKIVIYANYTPEVNAIRDLVEETGRTVETLQGNTKDRGKLIKRFQQKNDPKVLVIQSRTGSESITLTAADTCIFYSLTYSYTTYYQARARISRIGQESDKINFIHILAKRTIDEDIYKAIKEKRDVASIVDSIIKSEKGGDGMSKKHTKKQSKKKERIPVSVSEEQSFYEKRLEKLRKELEESEEGQITEVGEENNIEEITSKPPKKKKKDSQKEKVQGFKSKKEVEEKVKPESKSAQYYLDSEVITVKDLAYETGISSGEARRRIRKSNLEKPGGRWEWPPSHPDLIKVKALFGLLDLESMSRKELKSLCKELGIKVYKKETDDYIREKLRGEK